MMVLQPTNNRRHKKSVAIMRKMMQFVL